MAESTSSVNMARRVFGGASLTFGLIALVWHDYRDWDPLRSVLKASDGPVFLYAVAIGQIFGAGAVQFRRSAKAGAIVLSAIYLVFALLCVPGILAAPRVYNSWGNLFEHFSMLVGAGLIYAAFSSGWAAETVNRTGRVSLGICAVSFALEQALYLNNTAVLVPKWLPPGPVFWAIATTIAFGLAAVALITNRLALLAARLLTVMLVSFGVLVWIPLLFSKPRSHANWSETAETFAIAGTAWIVADLLSE
jgi:hypothetical protein